MARRTTLKRGLEKRLCTTPESRWLFSFLLQDYRFLLLDTFIRFLVNGALAAFAIWIAFTAEVSLGIVAHATRDPFYGGIVFTVACLVLSLFGYLRVRAQRFLTHAVFLRSSSEKTFSKLREIATTSGSDLEYLASAANVVAEFFSTRNFEMSPGAATGKAMAVTDPARSNVQKWVQAMVPLRFSRGDGLVLLLGPRKGGRRYLSEDLEMLERLATVICEQVERMRSSEIQALVSQAELRALQAQINPHFFFNALNTLYGVIARENSIARRLVLNLAGLFRHSFGVSSSLSALSEEIKIVRAYLEIEEMRLGAKLQTQFDIDESALSEKVPVLSIQPLVENAVQHGVACRAGNGFVRLVIRRQGESILVAVSNSGVFGAPPRDQSGHGIGMANVRRRLTLCYGDSSDLDISTSGDVTTVRFLLPSPSSPLPQRTIALSAPSAHRQFQSIRLQLKASHCLPLSHPTVLVLEPLKMEWRSRH